MPKTLEAALKALKTAAQERAATGRGTPQHAEAEALERQRADDVWTLAGGKTNPDATNPD